MLAKSGIYVNAAADGSEFLNYINFKKTIL